MFAVERLRVVLVALRIVRVVLEMLFDSLMLCLSWRLVLVVVVVMMVFERLVASLHVVVVVGVVVLGLLRLLELWSVCFGSIKAVGMLVGLLEG